MFTEIIGMLTDAVTFVYDTFNAFVNGSFFYLFVTMFVLVCVVRFLIIPIVGHGLDIGSDRVKAQQDHSDKVAKTYRDEGMDQKPASDYPD